MKRVFAAIDISAQARQAIEGYISVLRDEFRHVPVRWERSEKLHITAKFAGSLDEAELAAFTERMKSAAGSVDPFQLRIRGTGAFVKRRGPSVLWLGVSQLSVGDPLGKIAAILGHDGREFHPHVTIARVKDAKKAKALIERHRSTEFDSDVFEVNDLVIYESKLLPSGSVYSVIDKFPFCKE